jgi:4-hydroxy-3-polyprenylbenzoate decarboxylase
MQKTISLLKENNLLKIIDEPLDIYLEIPHIAYIETKKSNSKAILFTHPIDKKNNRSFETPILMNLFCNFKAVELFIGDVDKIASKIQNLLKLKAPKGILKKIVFIKEMFLLKNVFPKRAKRAKTKAQEIVKIEDKINLYDLPILTTWELDGGPFITMGQVYTTSLDGTMHNLGLYRLQVYDKNHLGMHWQIHKDSNHFFHEYKKANKKMPVSIAIGGDPLYTWCGQAPLPIGMFELLLYGFIKNKSASLVKSITNNIYIPTDSDFVIEGFVDTNNLKIEGPFGDHTGYYTLKEEYPVLEVSAITHKKEPIYLATVVGKPPLEDKYMGYATGKIFLPLLKTTVPDLIDYVMPENGVFHNLIIAKISPKYPSIAKQIMHAFWGVGQMSFVKHAIFVDNDAPNLEDYDNLSSYILNRFHPKNILISYGVCDALDHSSAKQNEGGKLGIDVTKEEKTIDITIISDESLLYKIKSISPNVKELKQYKTDTKNPIVVIKVEKQESQKIRYEAIKSLSKYINILVVVDNDNNYIDNAYMLIWRVVNNIDATRDIYIDDGMVFIDGTNKNEFDDFKREWPKDVSCTTSVLDKLKKNRLIDIDDKFMKKYLI